MSEEGRAREGGKGRVSRGKYRGERGEGRGERGEEEYCTYLLFSNTK